jgi:hypothetical protein
MRKKVTSPPGSNMAKRNTGEMRLLGKGRVATMVDDIELSIGF